MIFRLIFAAAFAMAAPAAAQHVYAPVSATEKAAAEAYLAASDLAPMPPEAVMGVFEPEPGVALESVMLATPGAKATIVIAPGFTAPLELYGAEMAAFRDAGYNVAGISHRGQGRSWRPLPNPEKAYVRDYGRLAADLAAFVAQARVDLGGPVLVYGNSMGGHVAIRMAGDRRPDVLGYGLLAPMARIQTGAFPYGVAKFTTAISYVLGAGESYGIGQGDWTPDGRVFGEDTDCSATPRNALMRHAMFHLDPSLRVDGVTNQWVRETMISTEAALNPAYLARIERPVFVITAGDDRIVRTEAAQEMCAALSDCAEKHYAASRHCVMQEEPATRDQVIADMIAFFDAQVGG